MDEKRMGEVALVLERYHLRREPVQLNLSFKRKIGNVAKETGVPVEELMEFSRILIEERIIETFGPK